MKEPLSWLASLIQNYVDTNPQDKRFGGDVTGGRRLGEWGEEGYQGYLL